MKRGKVAFCAHRTCFYNDYSECEIIKEILKLYKIYNTIDFYFTNSTFYDICARKLVKELKSLDLINCRMLFVAAKKTDAIYEKREDFDAVIYPENKKNFSKYSESVRDMWIVSNLDVLICDVYEDYGEARDILDCAELMKSSLGKPEIINLAKRR